MQCVKRSSRTQHPIYIEALRLAGDAADAFIAKNAEVLAAMKAVGVVAADAAAQTAVAMGAEAAAMDKAAESTVASSAVAESAMERWAASQLAAAAEAQAAADVAAAAAKEIADAYAALAAEVYGDTDLMDVSFDKLKMEFLSTAATAGESAVLVRAAMDEYKATMAGVAETIAAVDLALDALQDDMRLSAADALAAGEHMAFFATNADRAGEAAGRAGVSIGRFGFLSANAIHWLIAGSAELLAVLAPATVAAGAWAFAWTQGAQNVYQHMTSLFGATEALGQSAGHTMGQMLGLSGVWQKIQNQANPDVYQALGSALDILKESFGGLAGAGLRIGQVFDTFAARLVYDFSAAGQAGSTMNDLLKDMVPDLVRIGQIFGNLGAFIGSVASQMPGLAEVLLHILEIFTEGARDIAEFAARLGSLGFPILTMIIALEEFNRWGSLFVGMLGKMGFATAELSGSTGSYFLMGDRFIGILKTMISVLPQAAFAVLGLAAKVPVLGAAVVGTTEDVEAAKAATLEWIGALSAVETLGIAAALAALGYLIVRFVRAKSATEEFTGSLQKAAQAANDMDVLNVIGSNLSALQQHIDAVTNSMHQLRGVTGLVGDGLQYLSTTSVAPLVTGFDTVVGKTDAAADSFKSLQGTVNLLGESTGGMVTVMQKLWDSFTGAAQARNDLAQLRAGEVQQISDAGNVVRGAGQIAQAFGITVPEAMTLAQSANVNLTGAVKNQAGQWTVLGEKVRDAYYGYSAMGTASGAVGNDMLALAIQTGEAGTQMSKLNQAWDSWMSTITGGTSDMGALSESMQNLGLKAADSAKNLGTAATFTESSMSNFADSLKSYTGKGAQAWQNFDQVVGSTAPAVIDWLRTASTMGAVGGKQLEQAGLDMAAGLAPLAAKSRAAQTELIALAQDAGLNITTFPQLENAIKDTHASMTGLGGIVNTTTDNLGSMAQAAQNLGDVMNSDLTSAVSAAALKSSGFDAAVVQLTAAIQKYGPSSNQAAAAARLVTEDWNKANSTAGQSIKMMQEWQNQADRLHGVHITNTFTSDYNSVGSGLPGGSVGGGRYVQGYHGMVVGYQGGGMVGGQFGVDRVMAALSAGEAVLTAHAVAALGGPLAVHALNSKPSSAVLSGGGGGGSGAVVMNVTVHSYLDGSKVATGQRTESLIYNRRNPTNNLSLRLR
jgi:hypothetical protein